MDDLWQHVGRAEMGAVEGPLSLQAALVVEAGASRLLVFLH